MGCFLRGHSGTHLACVILFFVTGCHSADSPTLTSSQAVKIPSSNTGQYKLVMQRDTVVQLSSESTISQNKLQTMTDNLEMVFRIRLVSETPEMASYEVTCETVDARHKDFTNTSVFYDALKSLEGKSFSMVISNDGQWINRKEVETLFQKTAENSISLKGQRRIKRPDFVADFVAINYCMGSLVAQMRNAGNITKGLTWKTQEPTPWSIPEAPIPDKLADCLVQDIFTENQAQKVRIEENYSIGTAPALLLPNPYIGEHTMEGLLGFLRNIRFNSVGGTGRKVYNRTAGIVEQSSEHSIIKGTAFLSIPVEKPNVEITIDQTVEIRRVVELAAK